MRCGSLEIKCESLDYWWNGLSSNMRLLHLPGQLAGVTSHGAAGAGPSTQVTGRTLMRRTSTGRRISTTPGLARLGPLQDMEE